jgi:OOP family OmpA-OmpF porin
MKVLTRPFCETSCEMSRALLITFFALSLAACGSIGGSRVQIVDLDNDGVADELDACLQTREGSVVDDAGCELFNGPIADLEFPPGEHRLNVNARAALDKLVTDLNANPTVNIALGGHTDNRGSAASNLELSKLRVMSVVRYLVSEGIAGSRLKPYGYGESRPVVSNATLEGRVQNRRIEVSVIAQ